MRPSPVIAAVLCLSVLHVAAASAQTPAPSPHKLSLDQIVIAAFSPDGRVLMTVSEKDRQVHFWDVRTAQEVNRFGDAVTQAIFSANGSRVLTYGSDGVVRVFDSRTGKALRRLDGLNGAVRAMAISPDGSRALTVGDDHVIRVWDTATGRQVTQLTGHESAVNVVAFSPDGKLAASGSGTATAGPLTPSPKIDNSLRLWNLDEGSIRHQVKFPASVSAIAFSTTGKLVIAAAGNTVQTIDVASGKPAAAAAALPSDERFPAGLSTADRKHALRHAIGGCTLIDSQTGQEVRKLQSPIDGLPLHHAFSQDGSRVILGTGKAELFKRNPEAPGSVYVFEVATGRRLAHLTGHRREVTQVAISPDARHAFSKDGEKRLILWELSN